MTELPESWAVSTVGEIATVQLGRQRSPKNHTGPHMRPYLRSANVTWRGIDIADVKKMNFDPVEAATFELRDGDILLNEASGSPGEVGKPAIWRNQIPGACFQNTLLRVRSSEMDEGFLYWYFYNAAFTGRFGEAGRGVNIRHLGKQGLTSYRIPVPPLAEQRRIAAAIEEHFSCVGAGEEGLRRSKARVAGLDESAFSALVVQDWPTAAIAEVARVGSGSTPSRSESRYWVGGHVPWVTSAAVNRHRITEPSALITDDALAETSVKLWPPGTVLVAMYGEGKTRGKAAVLEIEATCNQACAAIVPGDEVEPEYLRMVLTSRYEQNRKLASGGVQPNLNLGLIREMRIPMPDIATQRQLVGVASKTADLIERLKSELVRAERRSAALRRSILAAAFTGRLVKQDPSDEPASILLERIAAERATSKLNRKQKAAS